MRRNGCGEGNKLPGGQRPRQEVADGSPAHVFFSLDVAAMGEGVDDTVALYGR